MPIAQEMADNKKDLDSMSLEQLRLIGDRRLAVGLLAIVLIPALWFAALAARSPLTEDRVALNVISAIVAIVGLWFVRRAKTRAQLSRAVFGVSIAEVPALVAIGLQQPLGWFYQPSQALLPLIAFYAAPNDLRRQVAPPLLLTSALIGVRVWGLPAQSGTSLATDVLVLALANVIGVVMVWRRSQLQRSVSESWRGEHEALDRERVARLAAESAMEELHTLRGIIPICSHCRQVRTDAGEWQQIERYVHEHSAAQFSHGICPACARKHYAEYLPDAT